MNRTSLQALNALLAGLDPQAGAASWLTHLVARGADRLPVPGGGATLARWQALCAVAQHDLSLAKLFEGHTDALAILRESGAPFASSTERTWGMWAAEAADARVLISPSEPGECTLAGVKRWCSGAAHVSDGLLTAWHGDGRGPQLVHVEMGQRSISVDARPWHAVGMQGSASIDIHFEGASARLVGGVGSYLCRPGFWQGGAGVSACWLGGALAVAGTLRRALRDGTERDRSPFRLAALGKVDASVQGTTALLREAASWIDTHPTGDARAVAARVRLSAEVTATRVLDQVGRALGAGPYCRDAAFARMAADLPVFIRQSHGERDWASLGEQSLASGEDTWTL